MKPAVASIEEKLKDKMAVQRVDVDNENDLPVEHGVRGVPTLILLDSEGNEKLRVVGGRSEAYLEQELNKILGS